MEGKKLTPPYLSKVKFAEIFNILSTRNLSKVSSEELQNYGFGAGDASYALVALRFLGLIDESNQVTTAVAKLKLKGEAQQKACKEIVELSYKDLFERVDEPYKLSSDELYNEFLSVYRISPRLARTAVPAFLWLCEFVGFIQKNEANVAKTSSPKRTTVKRIGTQVSNKISQKISDSPRPQSGTSEPMIELPFSEGIVLLIPKHKVSGVTFMSQAYRMAAEGIGELAKSLKDDTDVIKETRFDQEN